MTFLEYLQDIHAKQYKGVDDDMGNDFDNWYTLQDPEDVSRYAGEWLEEKQLLEYEYVPTQEEVRKHIQACEGRHTQQAVYSTFHDALTQVCYGCRKVRSSLRKTL